MKYRQISALLLSGCSPAAGKGEPSPDKSEPAVTDNAPTEIVPVESEEAKEPEELSP